jgi:hypothetical protein
MRFSLLCISFIALRSAMDQLGCQRTSFRFSIDAYRPMHSSTSLKNGIIGNLAAGRPQPEEVTENQTFKERACGTSTDRIETSSMELLCSCHFCFQ